MANRRFIDFPIASTVGDNDIVLIWQDGANKQTTKATILSGLPENLDELNDVVISGLTNGQILRYDSVTGKWVNTDQGNLDLNDLNDVSIVSPTNGQVLVYNSSTGKWENSSGGYVPYTGAVTTVNLGAQTIQAGGFVKAGGTSSQFLKADGSVDSNAYGTGTVTSVGLTMPSAFSVANSPITSSGTLAVTGAGTVGQYIRGDGSLADFPSTSGGGSSVSYYLNGSVAQGTIGGVAYKELSKVPVLGTGTDFTINADGYIASFLTDAGDPNLLEIPGGNWNFETYFSASSSGGTPTFHVELYKYDGSTFTLIASNSGAPEFIAFGTTLTSYFSTLAVPTTALALTDRLAIRYYVNHSGRTITLHTENNHLCQVITTFTTGLTALNGLTAQVQNFAVGTSGSDFNIASATATHTFNLPTASGTNRGALSSADWSTFNAKQNALTLTTTGTSGAATLVGSTLNIPNYSPDLSGYVPTSRTITINGTTQDLSANRTFNVGTVTSVGLSSATSGVTIGSTPVTSSGTITLAIATASGSQNGLLSSTDWTTFNNKQNALTNPVTGTGTTNYLAKFTGSTTVGNSQVFDNGTNVGIGTASPTEKLDVIGVLRNLMPSNPLSGMITAKFLSYSPNPYGIHFRGYDSGVHSIQVQREGNNSELFGLSLQPLGGNVLIGTTSDNGASLQVSGSATIGGKLTITADAANEQFLISRASNTNAQLILGYHSDGYGRIQAVEQNVAFRPLVLNQSGGNVLIGTTTDLGQRLQVSGSIYLLNGGNRNIRIGSATNYFYDLQTTNDDFQIIEAGATPRLTIKYPNGYVGIGTTSPATRLMVQDSANTYVAHFSGLNQANGIAIGTNSSNVAVIQGYTRTFSATNNIAMQVDGGNVGIGTSSPSFQLHVNRAGNTGIFLSNTTGNSAGYLYAGGLDGLEIQSVDSSNSSVKKLMLQPYGGNVLIGTTTDGGARLQIVSTGVALNMATSNGQMANINSTNANGGYITWQTSGTTIADLGTAQQIFGSGGNDTFGINGRGARALTFGTNDVERFRISSTGFVSAGATTNGRLGVRGFTNDSSGYAFEAANASGNTLFIVRNDGVSTFSSNVGIGTFSPSAPLHIVTPTGVNFQNAIRFEKAGGYGEVNLENYYTSGSNYGFGIDVAGTTMMVVNNSGNVGIGTASPYGRLELFGSGNAWSTAPAIRMWDSLNNLGWLVGNVNNQTAGDFYIRTLPSVNGNPSTGQEQFVIKHSTGNLGIGNTNPLQKLHITQAADTAYPTLGTGKGALFISGDTNLYGLYVGINTNDGNTYFQAMRNNSATAYNITMQAAGGNVLIGSTTDNGSKLQVNGAIRTAQPVGTTSNGWLLGRALVSGTSTPDRWIRVQIGLEYYDILAVYMGTL